MRLFSVKVATLEWEGLQGLAQKVQGGWVGGARLQCANKKPYEIIV